MCSSISTEPSLLSIRPICCSSASPLPHGERSRKTGRPAASARANAWCARSIWCARRQPQMDAFIAGIEIDPGFPRFVDLCRGSATSVTVVSDGLDRTIEAVLRAPRPRPALLCQSPAVARRRPLAVDASRMRAATAGACPATASAASPKASRGELRIVVGDGRSDFCVAGRADLVLAKSALLDALPCKPVCRIFAFENFDEATDAAGGLARRPPRRRRHRAAGSKGR